MAFPVPQSASVDGAVRRKQRTHPEVDGHGRARLVVVATEVGEVGRRKPVRS